jgi:hypothetical protein
VVQGLHNEGLALFTCAKNFVFFSERAKVKLAIFPAPFVAKKEVSNEYHPLLMRYVSFPSVVGRKSVKDRKQVIALHLIEFRRTKISAICDKVYVITTFPKSKTHH